MADTKVKKMETDEGESNKDKLTIFFENVIRDHGIFGSNTLEKDAYDELAFDSDITLEELDASFDKFKEFVRDTLTKYENEAKQLAQDFIKDKTMEQLISVEKKDFLNYVELEKHFQMDFDDELWKIYSKCFEDFQKANETKEESMARTFIASSDFDPTISRMQYVRWVAKENKVFTMGKDEREKYWNALTKILSEMPKKNERITMEANVKDLSLNANRLTSMEEFSSFNAGTDATIRMKVVGWIYPHAVNANGALLFKAVLSNIRGYDVVLVAWGKDAYRAADLIKFGHCLELIDIHIATVSTYNKLLTNADIELKFTENTRVILINSPAMMEEYPIPNKYAPFWKEFRDYVPWEKDLAGRGIVLSAPKEYKLPYKSFDKLNTYEGIKLSLGDRSGCSVECFVENGTKRSDLMSLNVGDEFIFFGGAKTILREQSIWMHLTANSIKIADDKKIAFGPEKFKPVIYQIMNTPSKRTSNDSVGSAKKMKSEPAEFSPF